MRIGLAIVTMALAASLTTAVALAAPSAKDAALAAGDWRRAAELGASAADIVRGLQSRGRFVDAAPDRSVVTIDTDNVVAVVPLEPLPPLEGARTTANLSGTGFAFGAPRGAITLYPPYATSFVQSGVRR